LQALAAEFGLSSSPRNLERIIMPDVPFSDVGAWRARLGELEGQVCRVEIPAGLQAVGTGFLVAPDLCLTNYHVIRPLIDKLAEPVSARLRFDYRRADDGTVVSEGTCYSPEDDWLAASRPPSRADTDPAGGLPGRDELDFAVFRVAGEPSEAPAGRADKLPDSPAHGWIRSAGSAPEPGHPLSVLQHPDGAPLKIAFGQSAGLNANATRLRHAVGGSSGSPCLNAQLELVGLHHAGDPNFDVGHQPDHNAAIPIQAITDYLADQGGGIQLFPRRAR
jgi:Trypsin-like peptidase domain